MHSKLRAAIETDRLVVFAGAGTSFQLGIPDWKTLVLDILSELEVDNKNLSPFKELLSNSVMSPLQVLDLLEGDHKRRILEILVQKINLKKSLNYSLQKKIIELTGKIITTNYDKAFEFASETQRNIISNLSKFKLASIDNTNDYIFKIHGDIDTPESCILFTSQYENIYNEPDSPLLLELKKILTGKTLLFLGFSMKDPFFTEMLAHLNKIYDNYLSPHFLITTDSSFNDEKNKSIIPILLPSYNNLFDEIEKMIEIKPQKTKLVSSEVPAKKEKVHFSILKANPINKDFTINEEIVNEQILKYNCEITLDFFNVETLQKIEHSDFLVILTKTIKNKFIIEDEYLKAKQIDLEEILDNIPSDKLKSVIILHDGDYSEAKELNNKVPVILIKITNQKLKDVITKFTYHFFAKKELPSKGQLDINVLNGENIEFVNITKGEGRIIKFQTNISKFIDQKQLQKIIGRKTDIENVIRKLIDLKYENKILTVKGSGGIGKTTIVTKAAVEIAERGYFKKGISFIPCQNITAFENFQFSISQCFDLTSSIEIETQIAENFGLKDRLIILDNFETLLYLEEKNKIIELVSFICDYASVVVTTRQLLDLDFEEIYELRNFTTDEGVELFKSIYPKVTSVEDKILREHIIERLLNNNPLAIKLIAKGLPPGKRMIDLKEELEENLFRDDNIEQIFERPEDINIEKSKSIYHSINYSYQRLSERERLTFDLLSLFPDGIHLENFKNFSKAAKKTTITVTDKEIKSLDDKSLLENANNFLKLQSIVSRFADNQFKKRDEEIKKEYYNLSFSFNRFLFSVVSKTNLFSSSRGLRFLDMSYNNFLKTLEVMEYIDDDNVSKLDFINDISDQFTRTNQPEQFLRSISKVSKLFEKDKKEALFIKTIEIFVRYWTKEFSVFDKLKSVLSLEQLLELDHKNDLDQLILENAIAIYDCEGYTLELMNYFIEHNNYNSRIDNKLYKLGYLNDCLQVVNDQNEEDDFGRLEIKRHHDVLNENEIDSFIASLFKKEVLEICQCTYIKSKKYSIKSEDLKKLVISNPYSLGLISLMQAFIENDISRARNLFEKAIKNLFHIKFYYLEAIFLYCNFLKSNSFIQDFQKWHDVGLKGAIEFRFSYLIYQFEHLQNQTLIWNEEDYTSKYALLSPKLNDFINDFIKARNDEKK